MTAWTPQDVRRPAGLALVRPVRVDPTGRTGPTRGCARGPGWVRTSHGYYVPSTADRSNDLQRILEASVLLPDYGGVTGWAALRWCGGHWFSGTTPAGDLLPVPLAVSVSDIREQPGIRVCSEGIWPSQILEVDGIRVTDPVRSTLFAMRYARSVEDAVVVADMAAYNDLVSCAELRDYALQLSSWTGIPRAREALEHVEENSWSPQESRTRVHWRLRAGLPRLLCNPPLFDRHGRHIGTPDLLDAEAGVVLQYDGALHLAGSQRAKDLLTEEAYRRHGLECLTVMSGDLFTSRLTERMHDVRRRALSTPPGTSWTLEQPRGWTSTDTVEKRRGLSSAERNRLLRYQLA